MKRVLAIALFVCFTLTFAQGKAYAEGMFGDEEILRAVTYGFVPDDLQGDYEKPISFATGAKQVMEKENSIPEDEMQRAIWYGFVPEALQTDLDSQITYAEFGSILSNTIALYGAKLMSAWSESVSQALASNQKLQRDEGALLLFYAAKTMRCTDYTRPEEGDEPGNGINGEDWWDGVSWEYPLFVDWESPWEYEPSYMHWAAFYAAYQSSLVSGKPLLELKADRKMHFGDALTRKEAILSALRLYESTGEGFATYGAMTSGFSVQYLDEIERAAANGFVPDATVLKQLYRTVSFAKYCQMISAMLEKHDAALVEQWKNISALAAQSNDKMTREDGILALYYAAELMGVEGLTTGNWNYINDKSKDGPTRNHYPLFPDWEDSAAFRNYSIYTDFVVDWDHMTSGYLWSMGQISKYSGRAVFEFDEESRTMRAQAPFTCEEAIYSVLRLYESAFQKDYSIIPEAAAEVFLAAEERIQAILDSETKIQKAEVFLPGETYTGTAYYVSPTGSDKRNGKSPEMAWATVSKVNKAKLKKGDAVFFERGGIWRGETLQAQEQVTYSAYGTGVKPTIMLSPENGADAAKWTLYYEGANGAKIWKWYKDIPDCGVVVFDDGERWADKVDSCWIGGDTYVVIMEQDKPFEVTEQLNNDLTFYHFTDMSKCAYPQTDFESDLINTFGPLYLRCDTGNPGELFQSIEFAAASNNLSQKYCEGKVVIATKDCVVDNLALKYGNLGGIVCNEEGGFWLQNCEIAWSGGATYLYDWNGERYSAGRGGGGAQVLGNTTVQNNYIHQNYDSGIEIAATFARGIVEESRFIGNVVEACTGGVELLMLQPAILSEAFQHQNAHVEAFCLRNIYMEGNYFLRSGSGFGYYHASNNSFSDYGRVDRGGILLRSAEDVYFANNVVCLAKGPILLYTGNPDNAPIMSDNTYIQYEYEKLVEWMGETMYMSEMTEYAEAFIQSDLGDSTSVLKQ